ncbi:MAG: hypothetical protein Q9160_003135 [Pyrenula sp. 1 TL-2023]
MHEFNLLPDGKSAVMTVYKRQQWDLSEWGIERGLGWIHEGLFQEVDVKTGEVLFEWGSLDHVELDESHTPPASTDTGGNGWDRDSPWDYFHINSIDKNAEGDYLISARHTSCIYKINGNTGEVLWRLHGNKPSFRNLDGLTFSHQHDARFIVDNERETVLSLFDNASNGPYNTTKDYSAGMIVRIDHVEKTARLLKEYASPDKRLCSSQANMQVLDPQTGVDDQYYGNVVLGWGNWAYWSESRADTSETVWYGKIADADTMNYRTMKFNWTGKPITKPAIWTYSKTGTAGDWAKGEEEREGGLSWFISWNGATEVATWRLFGSGDSRTGPWTEIGDIRKSGFETIHRDPIFYPYTCVEAVDHSGEVLSRSLGMKVFVPRGKLLELGGCDDFGCAQRSNEQAEEDARRKREEETLWEEERLRMERKSKQVKAFGGVVLALLFLYLITRFGLHLVLLRTCSRALRAASSCLRSDGDGEHHFFPSSTSRTMSESRWHNAGAEATEGLLGDLPSRPSVEARRDAPANAQVW